ncbi:MAG: OmpA family protein [Chitinispirillaceae bacterium]|nr:OmpA family protein [Chitinispirillaceae bacterium]
MKSKKYIVVLYIVMIFITQATATFNTSGHIGVVRTISGKSYGKAKINIGGGIHFGQSNDYVSDVTKDGILLTDLDPARVFSSNLIFTISPFSFWDIAANMPFYYDWLGVENFSEGGLGDLEVSMKLAPKIAPKFYYQSYYVGVAIPVGMKKNGLFPRHPYYLENRSVNPAESFYSSRNAAIKGLLLFTFDFGEITNNKFPLQLHINGGGVVTATRKNQRNTVIAGLGLELTPFEFLSIFGDFHGESRWSIFTDRLDPRYDPVYASPGFRLIAPTGLYIQFAGDFSLSSRDDAAKLYWEKEGYTYRTEVIPRYGVQFVFGWSGSLVALDDDHDGLKNNIDRCPKDAEDKDGFEDGDGCPDPDNDKDGIADTLDKCPLEPEDKDGFEDEDGCPDPDNDKDGIMDIKDQCPNMAEDFDGNEDVDGCPEKDNDKDGIADSVDKCINEAEDFDGFEDNDGCPEVDNDKDGIPDLKDKCPNEPEVFNNLEDNDGCPDSVKKEPEMPQQQILRGVNFKSGSAEMTFESYQALDPIVAQLKKYPQIVIEVRGHSDAIGSYEKNMRLSQLRAEAVRQYIISKGIDPERVRAVGFGSTVPIADNRTAAGRAINRRIEIVRIK